MANTLGFGLIVAGIMLLMVVIARMYEPAVVSEWYLGWIAGYLQRIKPEHMPILAGIMLFLGTLLLWNTSPAK